MIELSKKQLKLLSLVTKKPLERIKNIDTKRDDIQYLFDLQFIGPFYEKTNNAITQTKFSLTPQGKAFLYSRKKENKRFWIGFWTNFTLAVIAIIISVISLLKP